MQSVALHTSRCSSTPRALRNLSLNRRSGNYSCKFAHQYSRFSPVSTRAAFHEPSNVEGAEKLSIAQELNHQTPVDVTESIDQGSAVDVVDVPEDSSNEHYKAAVSRLEFLLAGVGDGYTEMFRSHITNMPPDLKAIGWVCVTLCFGLSAYLPIYFLDCFLEFDPIAFRSPLSWPTFVQAAEGIAAALPIMALMWLGWRRTLQDKVPVLKELQQDEVAFIEPLISGMSPMHLAFSAMSGAFAISLVVLPGIFEHIRVAAALSDQMPKIITVDLIPNLHEALERVHLPDDFPSIAWAIIPAGLIVALGEALTHMNRLSDKEQNVINAAMDNADRYYKMMHSAKGREAERAAAAFRKAAQQMLARGRSSAVLAGASHTLFTFYLGALYLWSGGFMAPAVASMLVNATHWRNLQAAMVRNPARRSIGGPHGPQ